MIQHCKSCQLFFPQKGICRRTGTAVNPEEDYCSQPVNVLYQCEKCGTALVKPSLVPDGDSWHTLCNNCMKLLNSCHFCKNVNTCEFETNPSPLPKQVQRRIQQGTMIAVETIKNPDRIREFCQKGCPCYSEEFECMREFNYCERIDHIYNDSAGIVTSNSDEVHSEIHE